jgi:modification methylase
MLPWSTYYQLMRGVISECYRVLVPGGVIAINVPSVVRWQSVHKYAQTWRDFDPHYKTHRYGQNVMGKGRIEPIGFELYDIMRCTDEHMREPIIWVKGSNGQVQSYETRTGCDSDPLLRSAHEFILLGSKEKWAHRGGTGRRGTGYLPLDDTTKDVWFFPPEHKRSHPAIFPVEIPRRLIRLYTHAPDAVVLDPFCGIGSTGVAAAEAGKTFIGIDLNESFLKEADRRISETIEVKEHSNEQ